ncbi:MAG: histidine--tRNA ligase [Acidimicrobiia bacterium]|nr:histidine--tRNA ligase [Acidimicrobiia bacterium]
MSPQRTPWPVEVLNRFGIGGWPRLRSAHVPEPSEPTGPPFAAPIGTRDVLPPDSRRWEALVARFAGEADRAGYGLLLSPLFESVGVFARMGEGTDVVRKEMYDFADKGGRHLALRPEGTASVVRAFVEHHPVVPWKVWYVTPAFRYERPQAGRYRQHHQVGVEAIGSPDPDLDVEVIALLAGFYRALGLEQVSLVVNTMGTPADRVAYAAAVADHLRAHLGDLDPEDAEKVDRHPLRVLDSKRRATQQVLATAPSILDSLDDVAVAHFERVRAGLVALGIAHEVEPRLVRGLDYYTHTLFEFRSGALSSAQNAIGGGGRYDGLVEALGGPPTPGIGFGAGIERILLTCEAEGVFSVPPGAVDVFVVDVTGGERARDLTVALRRAGLGASRAFDARSMKAQMKAADRSGAAVAVIVGPDEVAADEITVRPLRGGGDQQRVASADVVPHLRALLGEDRP